MKLYNMTAVFFNRGSAVVAGVPPKQTEVAWYEIRNYSSMNL